MADSGVKKNVGAVVFGILLMCLGMQFANYGTALAVAGDVGQMDAMQYYIFIQALGTIGMMLILPLVGKLNQLIGMRTLVFIGIILQVLGRVMMALKASWGLYAAGMLVQAIGGGAYVSATFAVIAMTVAAEKRAKYFGLIATFNGIGAIIGPIISSAVYASSATLATYFLFAPIVLIGFFIAFKGIPNSKVAGALKGFDIGGLLLTVLGILGLMLWMNLSGEGKMFAWASAPSIIFLIVGVVCIIAAIYRELKVDNPAVPFAMLKNKRLAFASIGAFVQAVLSTCTATYSVMWIRINYQEFSGATLFNGTASLGQQLVVLIGGLTLAAFLSAKFVSRFRGAAIFAAVCAVLSCAILYCIKFTGTVFTGDIMFLGGDFPAGMLIVYVGSVFAGFTSVITQSTFSAFWQSNTPPEQIPAGQALYTFFSTGGSAIFGAIAGVVLGSSTDYSVCFLVGLCFAIVGLITAIIGLKFPKEEVEAAKAAGK